MLSLESRCRLLAARLVRDQNHPDAGMSYGPREVLVADDNVWAAHKGIHVFQFGAYGVLAFGSLGDALEDAAAVLLEVAPGYFEQPDYEGAREECGADASEEDVQCIAESGLTYTEAGWLLSHEWTVMSFDNPADVRKWARDCR